MRDDKLAGDHTAHRVADDVRLGERVRLAPFVNLYGCEVGDHTRIGPFVEIQRGAVVGAGCKIQSHTFICDGVTIEDDVFVGHGVMFVNDNQPHAAGEWECRPTVVERGASIGSGAVILGGLRIGAGALVGAGAVVTREVARGETVAGVPAQATRPRAGSE